MVDNNNRIYRLIYILENPEKFSKEEINWANDPFILDKLGISGLSLEEIKLRFLTQSSNDAL